MRQLSAQTHLTTVLSLWGSAGPVVVHVEEDLSASGVVTVRVGSRLSMLSAQAIVFLAFAPDDFGAAGLIEAQPARARARIRMLIKAAQVSGVVTYVSDETGIGGVAAPIFDTTGICATLALLGTVTSTSTDLHRAEQVAEVAEAITREMGGAHFIENVERTG